MKIRGTALHIAEKYVSLARDAQSSGDRVLAENYLQHAEHYYRLIAAAQAQLQQPVQIIRSDIQDEDEGDEDFDASVEMRGGPGFVGTDAPQPYVEDGVMERVAPERTERPQRERSEGRSFEPRGEGRGEGRGDNRGEGRGEGRGDRPYDNRGDRRFGRDRFDRPRGERMEGQDGRPPRGPEEGDRGPRRDRRFEPRQDRSFEGRERSDEAEFAPAPRGRVNVEDALPTDELPAFITAPRVVTAPAPVAEAPAPAPAEVEASGEDEAPAPKRRARGTRGRGRRTEYAPSDETTAVEVEAAGDE